MTSLPLNPRLQLKSPLLPFLLLSLLLTLASSTASADQNWQDLFDGNSLKGWQGNTELWRVENGMIIGEGPDGGPVPVTEFLWHEQEFGDFVLEAEFRIHGGNSGIQYRSEALPNGRAKGYQADLDAGHQYTGILYEASGRAILAPRGEVSRLHADGTRTTEGFLTGTDALIEKFDTNAWHRYRIIVRGQRARHELDGVQVCAFEDQHSNHQAQGKIGLQIHAGEPMRIEWRQVRIRPWDVLDGDPFTDVSMAKEVVEKKSAHWIWSSEAPDSGVEVTLSRRFNTTKTSTAQLTMTADNHFIAFLDGTPILRGIDWSQTYEHRWTLPAGDHELTVRASNEGGPAGLLGTLRWQIEGATPQQLHTDTEWTVRRWTKQPQPANSGTPYGEEESWNLDGLDPLPHQAAISLGTMGDPSLPWGGIKFSGSPSRSWNLPMGFEAKIIHEVDPTQGSWVCIAAENDQDFIVSPQYGPLKRLKKEANGYSAKDCANMGHAQGILKVGEELWIHVNGDAKDKGGLWVLTDTDGDDFYETEERLSSMGPGWEHGVHALVMGPDGHVWTVVGNHIKVPEEILTRDRYRNWQEDLLFPRMWDPSGHAVGYLSPAGQILRIDPATREWERVAGGFRNPYDLAFHHDGSLFTYDADMEYDIGSPWYRAPRIVEVVSGGEAGWRSGDGKWPDGIPDAVPPAAESDLSSPTGVASGLKSQFEGRWKHAIFIADWAYGRILAFFPREHGSSFTGNIEPFAAAPALNVSDITMGPDGALYGVTGGRGTGSTVFRITSQRPPEKMSAPLTREGKKARGIRRELEKGHVQPMPDLLDLALLELAHEDMFIAAAARITLERLSPDLWRDRVLGLEGRAALQGLLALARVGSTEDKEILLERLCDLPQLQGRAEELAALRVATVAIARHGDPSGSTRTRLLARLDQDFPRRDAAVDRLLGDLLVRLSAPGLVTRLIDWLSLAEKGPEKMAALRCLQWTTINTEQRDLIAPEIKLLTALSGGNSYNGFIQHMTRQMDDGSGALVPPPLPPVVMAPFVQQWTREEILSALTKGKGDPEKGRIAFEKALCSRCHRYDQFGGGVGPDLTGSASRFTHDDLLTAILDPSRDISDQYNWTVLEFGEDGLELGRLLYRDENKWILNTDPFGYSPVEISVPVTSATPSIDSPMPLGLLNVLDEVAIRDLWAYLGMTSRE